MKQIHKMTKRSRQPCRVMTTMTKHAILAKSVILVTEVVIISAQDATFPMI